ncbi:MAG TPA: DUF3896 family protein [Bacillus bacterium]|nr:DUF3896 family protein [Bacillus sp. (in: firmicutes)]
MDYRQIITKIENDKINLIKMLDNKNLSKEEYESIKRAIDNYDYIIEVAEMNHYERGAVH